MEEGEENDQYAQMWWLEYQRQHDGQIPRPSLLMPRNSPWEMVLHYGSDPALITLSGFYNQSFHWLHDMFAPVFNAHSPYSEASHSGLDMGFLSSIACKQII
jgi:hypothetical protein